MKKVYCFLLLIIFVFQAYSLEKNDKREDFYKRLVESAHPSPQNNIKQEPRMLLLEVQGNPAYSLFPNETVTVDETGQYQMQNESSIAVNPKNPLNLISSAVDYRENSSTWVYVSHDGGKKWINYNLGKPSPSWTSSNDPSVAFDDDGVGYLVYGGFGSINDSLGTLSGENGVFFAKTTDEGNTWIAHIPIIQHFGKQTLDSTFEDKYYITVDNSPKSPFYKHLYVPWKRVTPIDTGTQIVISKSSDKGDKWTVPVNVSARLANSSEDTTFGQSFPLCATGPDGEVYIVWNYGPEHAIGFSKSTDGAKTFSAPKLIVKYNIFSKAVNIEGQGWRHAVKNKVRAESYPAFVCDFLKTGNLYLCWAADDPPNIYFSRSTDKGDNWSNPIIVHQPIKTDHFWQWIAMDPKNGNLAIMYFDSRNDSTNTLVDCYVSYSSNEGLTWIDRRASDISSDLRLNPFTANSFAGDYSGCAFYNGKIYPSWIDMRNAAANIFDSDVFTAPIGVNTPNPPDNFKVNIIPESPDKLKLTWSPPTERAFGQQLKSNDFSYTILRNGNYLTALPGSQTEYTDKNLNFHEKYTYKIFSVSKEDTSIARTGSAFSGGAKNPAVPQIISTEPTWTSIVNVSVSIPAFREDSITPLTNLSKVMLFRDSVFVNDIVVSSADTGKIITVNDTVTQNGYYHYMAKCADSEIPSNLSDFSAEFLIYAGTPVYTYDENFTNPDINTYKYNNLNWSLTGKFYHSSGYSIATSPDKNYKNKTSYQFWMYPTLAHTGNEAQILTLNFYHAAIVQPGDTAYVESSSDLGKTWKVLKTFDKKNYPQWQDSVLNQDDWMEEVIYSDYNRIEDSIQIIRFRLETDVFKTDKGWFIDDIKQWTQLKSVYENSDGYMFTIYPNPASEYLTINTGTIPPELIEKIQLLNILGQKIEFAESNTSIASNNITLRISNLPAGIYAINLKIHGNKNITKTVCIMR